MVRIEVDKDWWKTLFDDVYLLTDARSVCDEDITRREVDLVCQLLPVRPEHSILDLCGGHGRHSMELCARGFKGCTLVDFSQRLLDHASTRAEECRYRIQLVQADARDTGLPSNSFDHVIIMGNSLGYIAEGEADRRILEEAKRLLHSGGWLLIDVTDGSAVKDAFSPAAWHEVEADIVVCRQREMKGDTLHAREMVLSKERGLIRDCGYAIRLYKPHSMESLVKQAGFSRVGVHTDFSPHRSRGDFGFMNRRMICVAQKP